MSIEPLLQRGVKQLLIPSVFYSTTQISADLHQVLYLSLKTQPFCYSWNHHEGLGFLKTELRLPTPHLRQPISSESSKQSLVPSHLQEAGMQCPSSQRKCSLPKSSMLHSAIPQTTENQLKKKKNYATQIFQRRNTDFFNNDEKSFTN